MPQIWHFCADTAKSTCHNTQKVPYIYPYAVPIWFKLLLYFQILFVLTRSSLFQFNDFLIIKALQHAQIYTDHFEFVYRRPTNIFNILCITHFATRHSHCFFSFHCFISFHSVNYYRHVAHFIKKYIKHLKYLQNNKA